MILEEGLDSDVLRAEVEAIANAARAAGVEIVAGDTKVVERGHADQMYLATTGVGAPRPARAAQPAGRCGPATGSCCPARSASTARRSCSPAASSSSRPRWSPTRAACGPSPTRCSTPPATACAACATPPAAASPRCSTSSPAPPASRWSCARRNVPVDPVVAGAAEILGIDPMYVANEGKLVAFVAPEQADAALAALRAVDGLRARGGDRRGADRAAGDGACGDELRRPAGHGPAGGGPASADLLKGAATCRSSSHQGSTRRSRSPLT